jgi:hypothetical protein
VPTSRLKFFASGLFLFVLVGCGGGDKTTKPIVPSDGLPAGTPAADSPEHLAMRLEATWENEVEAEYAKLLTDDFRFHFSLASDPLLAAAYGDNWKRADEIDALTHLFHGFRNADSDTIPGANSIALSLIGVQYGNDPDHPDSTAQYRKVVITTLDGSIEVPNPPSEPIVHHISGRHELYLVRGDAAALSPGAARNTTHWYLRRWEDLSTSPVFRKGPIINPATPSSLGRVKSLYHDPPAPVEPPDGLPAGTPQADSPSNLALRLEATWEWQVVTEYAKLLTNDFRFLFSLQSDPVLVDQYPNWGFDDEVESTQHLFEGFTNSQGSAIPGASAISLTLNGVSHVTDFEHADSTEHYRKLVVTSFDGSIAVPSDPEPVVYQISSRQELYLVRGDAAVLPAGAVADVNRWYIRRWDDFSTSTYSRKGPVINPAASKSLGSIKAQYRF